MLETDDKQEFRKDVLPDIKEFNKSRLLSMEKETLGFYITDHPLTQYKEDIEKIATADSRNLSSYEGEYLDNTNITVCGVIHSYRKKTTRNNNIMVFLTLEDLYGMFEVIIFPNVYEKYSDLLIEDNIVIIKGKASFKEEEEGKLICEEVIPFDKTNKKKIYVRLTKDNDIKTLMEIKKTIVQYPGMVPIYFFIEGSKTAVQADATLWVDIKDDLIDKLASLVGDANIKIVS